MDIIDVKLEWRWGFTTRSKTKYIALHHAVAKECSIWDIQTWHHNANHAGVGYHFFVRKDGSIYRGRPIDKMGAHVYGKNDCSIGICAEGDYSTEKTMPQAQKQAIAELLDYIKEKYYPNAEIVGHGEIGASECPGKYYPLTELKNYKEILKESEDLDVTLYEELKKEIEALKEKNKNLEAKLAERTGYYNYIDDNMNKAYKPTVKKLVDEGIIKGNENGELMLTNNMMRMLVFVDRMLNKK